MRFTLLKDLTQDRVMRPTLTGLLLFSILYLLSDLFVKQATFGLLPQKVLSTLYGNEEAFIDPISEASFLEFWHTEIFFIMMLLFTLSTICIRLCNASRFSLFMVNAILISALVTLSVLPFAYYFSQDLIYLYCVGSILWHIMAFFVAIFSLKRLYFA